jgi:hypothetical protein
MADSIGTGGIVVTSIAVTAAVTALIMNIIYKKEVKPIYEEGKRPILFSDYFSILNWFRILYYFLPYALFLFGVIYDGLVRKIKFFPAGFIGLGAVYLNSAISNLVGLNTIDKDICGIPGMGEWGSDVAPQNIVFITTVLSYIATYLTVKPSGDDPMSYGSAWIGVIAVWIVQAFIFNQSGCMDPNRWVGGSGPLGSFFVPFIGLLFGVSVGGLSGGLIAQFVDSGSGVSSEQKQSLTSGSGPAMAPTSGTAGAGKCSPTDSDDAFVCEAYKNGELVTSTIVE